MSLIEELRPATGRWTAGRKAKVVWAIERRQLDRDQALDGLGITAEELASWEHRWARAGFEGLRETRIKEYRPMSLDKIEARDRADPPEALLEQMARAHDREDAAQKGEPSPWDIATDAADFPAFRADRLAAMRAAYEALGPDR